MRNWSQRRLFFIHSLNCVSSCSCRRERSKQVTDLVCFIYISVYIQLCSYFLCSLILPCFLYPFFVIFSFTHASPPFLLLLPITPPPHSPATPHPRHYPSPHFFPFLLVPSLPASLPPQPHRVRGDSWQPHHRRALPAWLLAPQVVSSWCSKTPQLANSGITSSGVSIFLILGEVLF